MDDGLQIRSFRVVFDLERRIHRIDRFRVPLPYGLPLRSAGYAMAGLLAVLLLAGLPVTGPVIGLLPAPARFVLLPAAVSYALTSVKLDGRSAHAAGMAWLAFVRGPRRLRAFAPLRQEETVALGDLAVVVEGPPPRRRRLHQPRRSPTTDASRQAPSPIGEQLALVPGEQLVMW
ncbi:MAG: hypothetical protein ACJ762_06575 [Solirubrobacteraceae bacterium]